ncbi:glycosyltransferase family 4 protein [Yersinia sp. 2544 StPb PI]|uniref:glycosyltransferase family 4 protein n=1 Tax=Yersinia sp. 2544 StPb PI TaxID=3117409 RepID=UPI003B284C3D
MLHFYKTYYPDTFGGIEQFIFQLCKGGASHGVDSTVLSLSPRGVSDISFWHGHRVVTGKSTFEIASTPFSINSFGLFRKLVNECDIVHYHFPYPFMDMMHLINRVKKKTIVTYHSDIIKQKKMLKLYQPLMTVFFNNIDHIVATSPNYMESSSILRKYREKTSIIPLGISPSSYPQVSILFLNKWRNIITGRFYLFIGALRYYKGLDTLLEAAIGTAYPIVILGAGPSEDSLKHKADTLGLSNVIFLGALSDEDKVALLYLCYAIVFPSNFRSEAFGISLLEGAMFSKPLITAEIGTGTTYVNIHLETGLVVTPSDPNSLRISMDYLWEHPDEAEKFGIAAKKRFDQLFTAEKMISKYIELYNRLLTR